MPHRVPAPTYGEHKGGPDGGRPYVRLIRGMERSRDGEPERSCRRAMGGLAPWPKPCAGGELGAGRGARPRRSRPALPPVLSAHGVVLDPARRRVTRDGREVPLSRKELAVLEVLMEADGAVVGAE